MQYLHIAYPNMHDGGLNCGDDMGLKMGLTALLSAPTEKQNLPCAIELCLLPCLDLVVLSEFERA